MRVLFVLLSLLAVAASSSAAQTPKAASPGRSARSTAKAAPSAPVNLNTATEAQLEALPGVGARAAQRIVEFRQKNGGFKKIEDLMNVKGFGERSFLKLKPYLTVAAQKADAAPAK